jgi:hypothetical protein
MYVNIPVAAAAKYSVGGIYLYFKTQAASVNSFSVYWCCHIEVAGIYLDFIIPGAAATRYAVFSGCHISRF